MEFSPYSLKMNISIFSVWYLCLYMYTWSLYPLAECAWMRLSWIMVWCTINNTLFVYILYVVSDLEISSKDYTLHIPWLFKVQKTVIIIFTQGINKSLWVFG